jgi:hypothetical protein
MAKLKYFTKGNGNPATIFLRFGSGRKFDLKKSTSLLINPGSGYLFYATNPGNFIISN